MKVRRYGMQTGGRRLHLPLLPTQREAVLGTLRERLLQDKVIAFAYVHGSFLANQPFHDVDLAVYLSPEAALGLSYEIKLEVELEQVLRESGYSFPVDVRLLNQASLAFRYRVIRDGRLLFCRDETLRVDFEVRTFSQYFDFAPFHRDYLQGVLGLGSRVR